MARFFVAFTICTTALCLGNMGVHAQDVNKGLAMATKSVQGACWYEYLKIKPDKIKKSDKFEACFINLSLEQLMGQFEAQKIKRSDYTTIRANMGNAIKGNVPTYLPAHYTQCDDYLIDPEKEYGQDYSAVLRDGSGSYPYKGWAHCLVGQMEEAHGQDAITAMTEKWSASSHPWINEIYNRENENRARHGAPPTKLNKELTKRAQKWADDLAKKCQPLKVEDHIQKDNPEIVYNKKMMGENIASRGIREEAYVPNEDFALASANSWYEEIRSYPWPAYKGKGNDPTFFAIGHFTSSVWKGVQQVGYGLGRRDGCDTVYVVGRYWPSGNVVGQFGENVLPLKE